MMTNLLVGLLFVICLAAGIWGWWLENGGSGAGTDTGADDEPGEADENGKSVM